jgi:hypothetical protein
MQEIRHLSLAFLLTLALIGAAYGQAASPDERARATGAQMTDDERFSLIISLLGPAAAIGIPRDKRIPEDVKNTSAGLYARHPAPRHPGAAEQRREHGRHQPWIPSRR